MRDFAASSISCSSSFRASSFSGRDGHAGGAPRARLYVLGAVRRDAVLSAGAGAFAARDLRRAWRAARAGSRILGPGAPPVDARVCERASAVAAVSGGVLPIAGAVSRSRAPKKFRFKNKLLSLDATVIELCAEMFPWATFRRTKGAVKLHFTLDHDGYLPTVLVITEGKRHETPVARQQPFAPGTILVFDRGYIDFAWFAELTAAGVFFVTRLKRNAATAWSSADAPPQHRGIVVDQEIRFRGPVTRRHYPDPLRARRGRTPEGERLEFLTNHLTLGASTVARIYQDRWQIELFFKASSRTCA